MLQVHSRENITENGTEIIVENGPDIVENGTQDIFEGECSDCQEISYNGDVDYDVPIENGLCDMSNGHYLSPIPEESTPEPQDLQPEGSTDIQQVEPQVSPAKAKDGDKPLCNGTILAKKDNGLVISPAERKYEKLNKSLVFMQRLPTENGISKHLGSPSK